MTSTPLRKETDQILKKIGRQVNKEYSQALKEVQDKLDAHFKKFRAQEKIKLQEVRAGRLKISDYRKWKAGQLATGRRWESLRNALAEDLAHHREIANSIVNGYRPEVYAMGFNYGTYEVEKAANIDTSFSLYNAEAVERIMRDNPDILPPVGKRMAEKLARGEAVKWEAGRIQSLTMQAILQGESVVNMANRIAKELCVSDRNAALRYARTAINSAENAGKFNSYKRASDMGLILQKQWFAVLDDRTRPAHRELDGQTVDLDKPFVNSIGEIMFPGDQDADGDNYWNCRCSMGTVFKGFERNASDLNIRSTMHMNQGSYEEWKKAKPVYKVISKRRDIKGRK